jgi:hypothetical protein
MSLHVEQHKANLKGEVLVIKKHPKRLFGDRAFARALCGGSLNTALDLRHRFDDACVSGALYIPVIPVAVAPASDTGTERY